MKQSQPHFELVFSIPFVIAFISLRHIFHELHEFAHMIVGKLICGVWGIRDFNNVHPMSIDCLPSYSQTLIGLEGPMVNYIVIWIGAILIRTATSSSRLSWGVVLIFTSLPFARIFTALVGGGDEFAIARNWIANPILARCTTISIILALLIYPLYTAFNVMYVKKNRVLYFVGFLILPMLLEGMVVLMFFNYLLKIGILNDITVMGSPILVWIVLFIMFIAFIFSARHIKSLIRNKDYPKKYS